MKPEFRYLFLAGLLIIHLIFLIAARTGRPVTLPDSGEYLNASANLYSQGVLYCGDPSEPLRPEEYTRRPPFYPVLLGIAILTDSTLPVFILQIAFSILSVLLVTRIFFRGTDNDPGVGGRRFLHGNRLMILITMGFLMVTPAQFIYASRIMAEIPFQLLLVLSAWSVFEYFRTGRIRHIWLFNLWLTLGMAVKPVLFPFFFIVLTGSIILFLRKRNPALLLALCLPVTWIAGYTARNYLRTGSAQYASIQTANLVNYNLRYFLMSREGPEEAALTVDSLYDVCGEEASYREKNRCLEQGTLDLIFDNPLKYTLFHLKGSIRFFLDPGRFDLVTFFSLEPSGGPGLLQVLNREGLSGAFRFLKERGWGLILLLALISLFRLLKISGFLIYLLRPYGQRGLRIYLALLAGYLALVTGPLGASRFLLPFELLLIGGAVKGWTCLLMYGSVLRKRYCSE